MNSELQKIVKFIVVGVSNVVIDVGLFNLLLLAHFNAYWAASISYTIAATNSFIHNRRWTFHDGRRHTMTQQYLMFMGANAIGYVFNLGLIYLFQRYLPLTSELATDNAAKVLAAGLIVVWNYSVSRFVVFRPGQQTSEQVQ